MKTLIIYLSLLGTSSFAQSLLDKDYYNKPFEQEFLIKINRFGELRLNSIIKPERYQQKDITTELYYTQRRLDEFYKYEKEKEVIINPTKKADLLDKAFDTKVSVYEYIKETLKEEKKDGLHN